MLRFASPIYPAFVTSGWGVPREYRDGTHQGLDFRAKPGNFVRAIAPGRVTVARYDKDKPAGMWVQITHADGYVSEYMHLSQLRVRPGQYVVEGQSIGLSGATGINKSKPHLHFQLSRNGTKIPAEPVVPADDYEPDVVANAKKLGIPLLGPRKMTPADAGVLASIGALLFLI